MTLYPWYDSKNGCYHLIPYMGEVGKQCAFHWGSTLLRVEWPARLAKTRARIEAAVAA